MSELTVTLLRFGYLLALWAFVWAAITVLRRDIFSSTQVTSRGRGRAPDTKRRPARTAPSPEEGPVARRLLVTEGKLAGSSMPLGKSSIVVGRAQSCTLVVDDEYASSRHARFFPSGGSWFVEDLGSTNGTFVGGGRIPGPIELRPGMQVRIGQSAMELAL